MRRTSGSRRVAGLAIVPLFIAVWLIGATMHAGRFVLADQTAAASARNIKLGAVRPGSLYAITLAVKDPVQIQGNESVRVTVSDAQGEVASKWLHAADLDFYVRPGVKTDAGKLP